MADIRPYFGAGCKSLRNVKNLQKLNQRELDLGLTNKKSWHDKYKDSAWIFVGGLPYDLTEGDVVCVFSQYGEIVNINLVRDQKTGKSKGYCFICYEDQRSTILSVDNLNGIKLLGRTLRVDHVEEYRKPKEHGDEDELTKKLRAEGIAPRAPESESTTAAHPTAGDRKKEKTEKVVKKKYQEEKKKKKKRKTDSESSSDSDSEPKETKVKREKLDFGYDVAENIYDKYGEGKVRKVDRSRKRSLSGDDRQSPSSHNYHDQERESHKQRTDRSETYRNDKNWDSRRQERYQDDTVEVENIQNARSKYSNEYRTESENRNQRRAYDSQRGMENNFSRDRSFSMGRYNDRSRDYDRNNRDFGKNNRDFYRDNRDFNRNRRDYDRNDRNFERSNRNFDGNKRDYGRNNRGYDSFNRSYRERR